MSHILLSHSSKDNFWAIALADWLRSEGWDDLFLDLDPERGIVADERWERALHQAANRCDALEALARRALIRWLTGIDAEMLAPRHRVARQSEMPQEARPLIGT